MKTNALTEEELSVKPSYKDTKLRKLTVKPEEDLAKQAKDGGYM